MAAQYMLTDGASEQSAQTPWVAAFDGFGTGQGFFLAARVQSNDVGHTGIEQTIASMFRGSSLNTQTWNWYLDNNALGIMHFEYNDSDDASSGANASGDLTADHSVDDNDTFWIGVSVRFPGTDGFVQWYFGGQGGKPEWATYGSEIEVTGFQDLIVDALNDFVIGLNRIDSGAGDYWWGRIFEVQYFANEYPNIRRDSSDLLAWFNAQDFTLNEGDTDTAVGRAGKTWTLTGVANMILNDAGVDPGGHRWWVDGLQGSALLFSNLVAEPGRQFTL